MGLTQHKPSTTDAANHPDPRRAPRSERQLFTQLEQAVAGHDNICYFAVALIKDGYDPQALAALARDKGQTQRLGYLAELCAETAGLMHLHEQQTKLSQLYTALNGSFAEWQHLNPALPDWGRRLFMYPDQQTDLNKKWSIYSGLRVDEVEDFADLYVTKDYTRFTPEQRFQMQEQGIKYTRLERP